MRGITLDGSRRADLLALAHRLLDVGRSRRRRTLVATFGATRRPAQKKVRHFVQRGRESGCGNNGDRQGAVSALFR